MTGSCAVNLQMQILLRKSVSGSFRLSQPDEAVITDSKALHVRIFVKPLHETIAAGHNRNFSINAR
jgi:hypothetical protein